MSKRIVFCADGTWDSSSNNSNVSKLYGALAKNAAQPAFYDDGVGADGTPVEKLVGGAIGAGLFGKVQDGYRAIAQIYGAGDEIFLFGFSRGAYTARSLAGMIAVCGLPTRDFDADMVATAFQAYRDRARRDTLLAQLNAQYGMYDAKLTMVGVWDTVGSLGIPALFGGVDPLLDGFLDTSLHPDVLHAYQALSIDEKRREFPPTLWTAAAPGQVLEQVWFSGVHTDVGGGYPPDADGTALSDVTLAWMLSKALPLGVTVDAAFAARYALPVNAACALATKHESWNLGWGLERVRNIAPDSVLANSVRVRCEQDATYRPANLTLNGGELADSYGNAAVVAGAEGAAA